MFIRIGENHIAISQDTIREDARNIHVYETGKQLYQRKTVKKLTYSPSDNSFRMVVHDKNTYNVKLVYMKRGHFSSASCHCTTYQREGYACTHTVAAMMAVLDYFTRHEPGNNDGVIRFDILAQDPDNLGYRLDKLDEVLKASHTGRPDFSVGENPYQERQNQFFDGGSADKKRVGKPGNGLAGSAGSNSSSNAEGIGSHSLGSKGPKSASGKGAADTHVLNGSNRREMNGFHGFVSDDADYERYDSYEDDHETEDDDRETEDDDTETEDDDRETEDDDTETEDDDRETEDDDTETVDGNAGGGNASAGGLRPDFDQSFYDYLKKYSKQHLSEPMFWPGADRRMRADVVSLSQSAQAFLEAVQRHVVKPSDLLSEMNPALSKMAKLTPTLIVHSHGREVVCFLALQLGIEKAYIVRDIQVLLESYLNKKRLEFTSNFIYSPTTMTLDEKSQQLMQLLLQVYKDEKKLYAIKYASSPLFNNKKELLLADSVLIAILNLYMHQNLTVKDIHGNPSTTQVVEAEDTGDASLLAYTPEVGFEAIPGGLQLQARLDEPALVLDTDGEFILAGKRLIHTTEAYRESIIPLLRHMRSGSVVLQFPETRATQVFSDVVPYLKKGMPVHTDPALEAKFYHEPLQAKIYFDLEESRHNQAILARVEFHYGNIQFFPAETHGDMQHAVKNNDVWSEQNKENTQFVIRSEREERALTQYLKTYGFMVGEGAFTLRNEQKIYEFVANPLSELKAVATLFYSESFKNLNILSTKTFKTSVRLNEDSLLSFTMEIEGVDPAELAQLMKSLRLKKKYYRLKNGSFIPLQSGAFEPVAKLLADIPFSEEDIVNNALQLPAYRALYLDTLLKNSQDISVERNLAFDTLVKNVRNPQEMVFAVPEALEHILRDYQKVGFHWLKTLSTYGFGGILADDMGLGKTLQMIAFLLSEKAEKAGTSAYKPAIVVAPTSLVYNWQEEVKKFTDGLNVLVIAGTVQDRKAQLQEMDHADLIITTYGMMKRDAAYYKDLQFSYCILDEAQHIKNPNTLNAKSVKMLKASCYFALTGTPIENSLAELWSAFDFIMPGYLYTQGQFTKKYEVPIVRNHDKERLQALSKQIQPFILRRMKRDVLTELPEKTETKQICEMQEDQKKIYLAYLEKARQTVASEVSQKGIDKSRIVILAILTRLRQICCHPNLFIENYHGSSAKLEMLFELLEDALAGGHRVLLFSQFTGMLQVILEALEKQKIGTFYLDGGTKAQERMRMVNAFNDGENSVFLISLKAGGTGLNLTGADVVIHYDPWWNPAVEDQATDRAYRIGQKNPVQVLKLLTKGTIEEKIFQLQQKKKELIDSVIQPGENFLSKMSGEEIQGLFEA